MMMMMTSLKAEDADNMLVGRTKLLLMVLNMTRRIVMMTVTMTIGIRKRRQRGGG